MISLKGTTALITGASSGIGLELARQLAPHARSLILVARRPERLEALRVELQRPGLAIHCHVADLAQPADLDRVAAIIRQEHPTLDFLINNAGVGDHGPFEESEWSRVQAMLDVNIRALTLLTHALLPILLRSRRAAILNVSSIASMLPVPQMAVYAATKAYVTSFSEALRAELRGTGVSVTALCPGPVETEFFQQAERTSGPSTFATPDFFKVSVGEVARAGLAAVERDRARVIPGWQVYGLMAALSLVPIGLLRIALAQRRPTSGGVRQTRDGDAGTRRSLA